MRRALGVMVVSVCSFSALAQSPLEWYRSSRFVRIDRSEDRLLATPPPARIDWHHTRAAPGIGNGRLWSVDPIRRLPAACSSRAGRGPGDFGVRQDGLRLAFATIGTEVIAFEPWERFGRSGFERLDRARAVWLRERGLTGGVRTFVNPVSGTASSNDGREATPSPSGWFRRPSVLPRTKPVESVRFSVPPGMDPRLAAALIDGDRGVAERHR